MTSSSVSLSPSISAIEQRRGEVVLRLPAALVDHVLVVADQGEGGLHAGRRHVEQPVLPVHHQVGQPADLGPVDLGHADQLRDDVHGQLAGEVGDEVEGAALERRLEVLEGDGADPVLHLGDLGRREALAHQRPHAGVPGRVEGEERHEPVGVRAEGAGLEGHPVGVRESVEIAEGGQHVLVPRQRPEVELVVAVHGRFAPEPGVDRVGVLVDLVVVGAVGDATPIIAVAARFGVRRRSATPATRRSAAPATNSGMSIEDMWPMPGGQQRPREGGLQHAAPPVGSAPGPSAAASRRWICAPIRSRRCFTSGLVLSSATVHASTRPGLSVVKSTMARTASTSRSCIGRFGDPSTGGQRLHPPPEHLGQQVVLRAEVGVGGGRGHAGPPGHDADGEPVVAPSLASSSAASTSCVTTSAWRAVSRRRVASSMRGVVERGRAVSVIIAPYRHAARHRHRRPAPAPPTGPAPPPDPSPRVAVAHSLDYSLDTCPTQWVGATGPAPQPSPDGRRARHRGWHHHPTDMERSTGGGTSAERRSDG